MECLLTVIIIYPLEIYLLLSILILNETIRVDLVVFLAIFADVATLAIAYDNAPVAQKSVEWQLPKIWVISAVMGIGLAAGTWIARGTLFLKSGGLIQNFGDIQSILFLEVSLTENWLIFITRGGGTLPSWKLVGAILGVDILATLFCLFGWINGPDPSIPRNSHGSWTDVVTVVKVWCFSFGVIIILAMVYYLLNQWSWLDNLGRINRVRKNTEMENTLAALQQLTIVHQRGVEGGPGSDTYRVGTKDQEAGQQQQDDKDDKKKDEKKGEKKDEKKDEEEA